MSVTWYARCKGEGLDICDICRRNMDNQPTPTAEQQYITPTVQGGRCGDWMAIPTTQGDGAWVAHK
jgi:hypothetical protein